MGKSLFSTLLITFATSIFTILIITIGSLPFLLGNWGLAFLTGAMLSGTSSAVVIPMVQSLKLGEKISTVLILESALTDVICIVLTFALVESIHTGHVSFYNVSMQMFKSLGYASIVGVLGGLFWLKIWNKVRKIPSSVFTTIAFAFVLYGLAEILHISGAIAVLAFGITLANLPIFFKENHLPTISESEGSFYKELVFLLKTFFFVFLGISIRLSDYSIVTVSLILVIALYLVRLVITRYTLSKEDANQREAVITSVMIPKGLAPAVLVSLVVQKGLPMAQNIQAIVFSFIIFSIILTAVLVPLTLKPVIGPFYSKVLNKFKTETTE